jgi:hypothetical protein
MAHNHHLYHSPPMMIKRDGKYTGKRKANRGGQNQRLTLSGKRILLSDVALSMAFGKTSAF